MAVLKGIPASNGIGLGKALIITPESLSFNMDNITPELVGQELLRAKEAAAAADSQLTLLYESVVRNLGGEAEIIQAQREMLKDPVVWSGIEKKIKDELFNAEHAVSAVFDGHISVLSAVEDEYLRERAADLADVKSRLLGNLTGSDLGLNISEEVVIVCDTLTPSQTANLDPEYVKGIVCEGGGVTAHTAIIARNLEIPTVMGCADVLSRFSADDVLFIDGSNGEVYAVGDEDKIQKLRDDIARSRQIKAELLSLKGKPATTKDGKTVGLYSNIGSFDEVKQVIAYGGDGVGLFRTEFLYMEAPSLPSEETQFRIYKNTVEKLAGKKVVFRTLDIGGDKDVPYLKIPKEDNPFLGWRAVRICLDESEILKTQLRALLRASAFGGLKIMVPMISSVTEIKAVKKIFEEVKDRLRNDGTAFDETVELGIMVEIPSAAICSESLIKEADFFSIGTNDLIQYTLAVDRGNKKVSKYYDFFNPAVLRLVKQTIDASHSAGKTTSMCGEAAGDVVATLLLLGLGLDGFSMSSSTLPKVKKIITQTDVEFAKNVADAAMEMETPEEIRQYLTKQLEELGLGYLILL